MTVTTSLMSLLQAQGTDNARDYLKTYLASSLTLVDAHDHSSSKGAAVKRLANGTLASQPAAGNAGHVYVATDSNRAFLDNGTAWLEAVLQNTTQLVTLANGLKVTAGNMGVGAAPLTWSGLFVSSTMPSAAGSAYGANVQPTGDSSATGGIIGVYSKPATTAAAYTATEVSAFHAGSPSKGAGSTITSAYGLLVDAIIAGNTNNYGIYINAPSGGSGSNFSLWAPGYAVFGGVAPTISGSSGVVISNGGAEAPVVNGTAIAVGSLTTASATAGVNGAPPAQVVGYIAVNIGGTARRVPYYAV